MYDVDRVGVPANGSEREATMLTQEPFDIGRQCPNCAIGGLPTAPNETIEDPIHSMIGLRDPRERHDDRGRQLARSQLETR